MHGLSLRRYLYISQNCKLLDIAVEHPYKVQDNFPYPQPKKKKNPRQLAQPSKRPELWELNPEVPGRLAPKPFPSLVVSPSGRFSSGRFASLGRFASSPTTGRFAPKIR